MVILFTVMTIKNRHSGESMSGFIWRRTAKVCVKIRPIRRFRELCPILLAYSEAHILLAYSEVHILLAYSEVHIL